MTPFGSTRLFLFLSLALFGGATGLTASILRPDGLVRARSPVWGPDGAAELAGIEGYGADRRGGLCGLRRVLDGVEVERAPLPDCHSYQAPSVVAIGSRAAVVWERGDSQIAVSTLGSGLTVDRTVLVRRPQSPSGAYLPRTAVRGDAARLAVWYRGDHVVSVSSALAPWPGGAGEVAAARLGPRAFVLLFGIIALLTLYFAAAGWTLVQPRALRRRHARGACLEAKLPRHGTSLVIDGRAIELDLSRAWAFGGKLEELVGETVTLVLGAAGTPTRGDAYRRRDGLAVSQVWAGDFAAALARARALRAQTIALAIFATAILLLSVDAYLAL